MPTYSWWAKTIDRKQKTYNLSGTFYLEDRSYRAAEARVLQLAQEWHNGDYIVVRTFDLEVIDAD